MFRGKRMEFLVEVRKYGGRNQDRVGPVPTLLDDIVRTLQETRLEIPMEYRADARVDISTESDMDCLSIYYYRPRTPEEIAADELAVKANWEKQLRNAEERARYCREQLEILENGPL
jgi:hypothetical protein